ncbi:hypothetical protein I7I50_01016 [Histoplasma capsulatum G186AR]|uniref:Uncharacterized protein n=1 Tax=Ajellomyces capsulatus TaxID=5037 RepID=A0A8H7YH73_AJECA|nr:hypothetical protein I7I52_08282 [Histoplasma capsulatum]QSS72999.1 hypothetical protein I7I50_01016 [Histoplasma capsulatum G186AR]
METTNLPLISSSSHAVAGKTVHCICSWSLAFLVHTHSGNVGNSKINCSCFSLPFRFEGSVR